jgi:hypothetical protein
MSKICLSFIKRPDGLKGPPSYQCDDYRDSALGIKLPVHKMATEVKNEWSYSSVFPVCLHGLNRDNFTF